MIFLTVVCTVFLGIAVASGRDVRPHRIAVLVSRDIRPYIEAAEGLSGALAKAGDVKIEVFSLEKFKGKDLIDLSGRLAEKRFALFVAIGPGAARFVWKGLRAEGTPMLYSIVLNPQNVLGPTEAACGISLNIPVQRQLEMVALGLPAIRRLGLLYDPDHNSVFFRDAAVEASFLHLEIVPLEVSSKTDIPVVLKQHWKDIDALWLIPDRTVISESIVQYVIKEAILQNIAVIGYNRFFYESGAALAFVFDYEELGRQCAKEAIRILSGEACQETPPLFRVWINARVVRNLGIDLTEKYTFPIMLGP